MSEEQPQQLEDFVVSRIMQIGIKAVSHEEAVKAVMQGGGDVIAMNYSVSFRAPVMVQPGPRQVA